MDAELASPAEAGFAKAGERRSAGQTGAASPALRRALGRLDGGGSKIKSALTPNIDAQIQYSSDLLRANSRIRPGCQPSTSLRRTVETVELVCTVHPSTMSSIRKRVQRESIAQQQIRDRLEPLAILIDRLDSLYDRALNAIAGNPEPGAATKVALIVATRLADDLRVCSLTSYLGYGLQALVFAGTIMELVGSLSYVGSSDDRAISWAEHGDRRRSFPPKVSDGIKATLTAIGEFNPATCENWKKGYEIMCMAKHGNPYLSLLHGLRIDSLGAYHVRAPDPSDFGIMMSSQALHYAITCATAGIHVALDRCTDSALQTQLRSEALTIAGDLRALDAWFRRLGKTDSLLARKNEETT